MNPRWLREILTSKVEGKADNVLIPSYVTAKNSSMHAPAFYLMMTTVKMDVSIISFLFFTSKIKNELLYIK